MTAAEARALNEQEENVNNAYLILERVRHAIRGDGRLRSIEVENVLMTAATKAHLLKLEYHIQRKTKPAPTPDKWNANKTVYIVSW